VARDRFEIRSDARRFENWEANYAGKLGLGVAIDYAMQWGIDAIWRRVKSLAYQLRTRLSPLLGVIVRDRGITQCGIVTFTLDDVAPAEIQRRLAAQNINVSVTVLNSTRLDLEARGLSSMVRASVHYYNSEEEIEQFCAKIAEML
jgi:cysteine desulfurase/selenocysteine lyase